MNDAILFCVVQCPFLLVVDCSSHRVLLTLNENVQLIYMIVSYDSLYNKRMFKKSVA